MDPSLGPLLALGILSFLPGTLLYRAVRPRGSALECAAVAPTLSFALVFLFGQVAAVTGAPFAPLPFVVAVSALALVAGARWIRRPDGGAPSRRPSAGGGAAALLAGAVLLAAGTWLLGIHGLGTTPPYTDSVNHGLMAAQVAAQQTLDPGTVLSSDAATAAAPGETAYYPLALHGVVALAHLLFGIGFADGLLAATLLFSAVVLPLGLFLAVRRLVPEQPLLAGLTALMGATIGFFPVLPLSFGGLPLVIGMAMVPAVAVIAGRYLAGAGAPSDAALGGLGAVGILATHTSEIPLLALFLAPVVVESLLRRRQRLAAAARRGAVFVACCALLTAPTLPLLAGGTAERSGIDEGRTASIGRALGALRSVIGEGGSDVVVLLAVAGLVLSVTRRRHLPVVATTAAVLGLYAVASGVQGPLRAITVPWYQHPGRIALNLVLMIPFFSALALHELVPALLSRRGERASYVPVVAVGGALALAGFSVGTDHMRTLFEERVVVGEDARAAFAYLETQVQPGERVLNDANTDGSMWMYPFEGVVPLLGLHPARPTPSWNERLWLVENLPALGDDPRIAASLEKHNVRFVYFDERTFTDNPHHLDGEALRHTPGICPRFRRGTVAVYEIVGSDCAAPV